jgi:hypothetical protein
MPKTQQADLVWEHLFRQRLPISEAQIGVVTTLQALGLSNEVEAKDLAAIRKWFAQQVRIYCLCFDYSRWSPGAPRCCTDCDTRNIL